MTSSRAPVGTARHEMSHATAASLEHARVTRILVLPRWHGDHILFGYASWIGPVDWMVTAAPYFIAALMVAAAVATCLVVRRLAHWVRVNTIVLAVLSPLVNSAINDRAGVFRRRGGVAELLSALPPATVQAYFWVSFLVCLVGLVIVLCERDQQRRDDTEPRGVAARLPLGRSTTRPPPFAPGVMPGATTQAERAEKRGHGRAGPV
jgi:hypothetical protein